jgi:hypothetical protein
MMPCCACCVCCACCGLSRAEEGSCRLHKPATSNYFHSPSKLFLHTDGSGKGQSRISFQIVFLGYCDEISSLPSIFPLRKSINTIPRPASLWPTHHTHTHSTLPQHQSHHSLCFFSRYPEAALSLSQKQSFLAPSLARYLIVIPQLEKGHPGTPSR